MKLGFYAGRRILLLVPVLLGVTFITFALTRLIPGDPISLIAGPYVSAARKAQIRHAYFLDQPFYIQYVRYLGQIVHGNLGTSIVSGQSVATGVRARFLGDGADHADRAAGHDRGPRRAADNRAARAWSQAREHRIPPRAQERNAALADDDRHRLRLPARGLGARRDDLLLA